MQGFYYTLIFILGLCIGSFINALVYRLHSKTGGLLTGRSFCPKCKKKLSALELVPVLSFILLRGKCKHCHQQISWQYPVVELVTGLLFLLVALNLSLENYETYLFLLYTGVLVSITVYDFLYFEIPDEISIPVILFALIATLYPFTPSLQNAVLGALIPLTFFGLQFLLSKGKFIGGGDLRLGVFMGLILGWKLVIVALCLAYFIGAIVSLPLLIFKRKAGGTPIPFAPLLSLGTFLSFLWGSEIMNWYLTLIL